MAQPELARDQRFGDVVNRYRNQDDLDEIISNWTRVRTRDAAAEALQMAGVAAMPVVSVPEVFEDAQLRAREFFETVSHAVAGMWEMEGPHWRTSETPAHIRLPAPTFAEHNDYVFELLGLTREEIGLLEAEGVTGKTLNLAAHQ
jgi:crotonobetainyl-CoA:carnitine CoA-transferase CaiB-like acyl-CoA transferase